MQSKLQSVRIMYTVDQTITLPCLLTIAMHGFNFRGLATNCENRRNFPLYNNVFGSEDFGHSWKR